MERKDKIINLRKMTDREIKQAKEFINNVERLRPKNKQILSDYNRTIEKKVRGWKTQISENVKGV